MKRLLLAAVTTAVLAGFSAARAETVAIVDDPLHGICSGCTSVVIGGNAVTQLGPNGLSSFGFASSPPNATGDLQLKFLIPNSYTLSQVQAFDAQVNVVSGTGVVSDIHLYSPTAWTAGFLETDYLGNTLAPGAPKNPLDAWIGATNTLQPGATGYYLLTAEVGTFTLGGPNDSLALAATFGLEPLFYAQGGLIVGNLFTADGVISTAQSGALFNGNPSGGPFCAQPPCTPGPTIVPGPIAGAGALPLLGAFAWFVARRRRQDERPEWTNL